MLRKFSVANYKNFEKELTLDFTKVHDYKFNTRCTDSGLLSKILMVGKNGSGKTNFAYALFDIVYTLTDNTSHPLQKDVGSFINGNSGKDEASFTYEFLDGSDVIRYTYGKTAPLKMTRESFSVNDKVVFDFDYRSKGRNVNHLDMIGAESLNTDLLDGSLPALRIIANNTVQGKESPVRFVMDFANRMLYYRSCQDGNTFIGLFKSPSDIEQYIIEKGLVRDFEKFLNETTGLGISLDVFTGPSVRSLVQKFPGKSLYFQPIASSGTKALELYYFWSRSFGDVSFLFIDEFDAYYHFELSCRMMDHVLGNVDAQTVLTAYNTKLTDNDLMRPDCCLLIENGVITSFADRTSKELREGHNIEKMFRSGTFCND